MAPDGNKLQRLYPYGGMSEYLTSPSTKVARLTDNIDFNTAARFGYLGTSYAALLKGKLRPRGTLLINGVTGTLGVGAVQIALGLGARRILGIGRKPDVMARIKSLAPDRIDVTSYDPATTVQWVKDRTGGRGVDVMYDCLGAGGSADWTSNLLNAIAPDGSCVLVAGGVDGQICRDYLSLMSHPISIVGSGWFTSAEIDDFIELIGDGTIDVSACETRAFRLDQVNDAIALAGSRPGGFVNVVIHPQKE
jgi:alcohol dehydrogenase